jgi:HK97 family phage major capsid protein
MAQRKNEAPERRKVMALKTIMLRKRLEENKTKLEELREKEADFKTREQELEVSISEAKTEEEKTAVDSEIEKFEGEKEAYENEISELEAAIANQERELEEIERKDPGKVNTRGEKRTMSAAGVNIRELPKNVRAMDALTIERRQEIVEQEDVKSFLKELRDLKGSQRSVTGADLTIPVVFLDLISENVYRYSKLINRVRVRNVAGEARQTIAGTAPEAVWTEMCGAINELTFGFNQVVVDGYKVAGFIPVCNSLLEDSDIELAASIVEMISEAIGLAKDKAILYGKGSSSRMPLGIVTRLAQSTKPSDYPVNAPDWVDLHTTNIQTIAADLKGAEFWSALMLAAGNTFTTYSRGTQFWAMNSKTYSLLKSKMITFTATGEITAAIYGSLPIITGDIDILEFIPDGDIIGGYGDLYLWAQRSGMSIESSTEVQFIQDNTVFKGKERADGTPIVPGAFVAININGSNVTTEMSFAADKANNAGLDSLTIGNEKTTPAFATNIFSYTMTASAATDKIEVTTSQPEAKVAISYNGKNVRNGGTITWEAGTMPLTVTVTNGNAVRVYTVNVTKASA